MKLRTQNGGNNAWNLTSVLNNNNWKHNRYAVLVFYALYNMNEYVTIDEIDEAYRDCIRHKRNKTSAVKYSLNYLVNNYELYCSLNNKTYNINPSTCFCVTRPKLREIFAADFRDRIVHHLIILKFGKIFEDFMIDNSYSCRKGKGTLYAAKDIQRQLSEITNRYKENAYILKLDLKGFFINIDKEITYNIIEKIIKDNYKENDIDWWLWLIKKVIFNRPDLNCIKKGDIKLFDKLPDHKTLFKSNGKGLPLGNLTSQIFANLYLTIFDKWIIDKVAGYGRYADDFILIDRDKDKLLKLWKEIKVWLEENLKLELSPNKYYFQQAYKGVEFVGFHIKKNRLYTNNNIVHSAFQLVEEMNKKGHTDLQRINSYFGFLRHTNSYKIKARLIDNLKNKDVYNYNLKYLKVCSQQ